MKNSLIKTKLIEISQGLFLDYPVIFAYLYGSYAIDQAHAFSDLDISVYVKPLPLSEQLHLEMMLSLEIDKSIEHRLHSDVRVMNQLPLVVIGNILSKGMLLYSRDDAMRVDYETKMRSAYFDFLPFIRNYRRIYLANMAG